MTGWSGLLLFVGLGVYGINQMLGMEYGHTGEICKDDYLIIVIGLVWFAGLVVDFCNWCKQRRA